MVYSPGKLFNIPESVRMSPGKKRNFTPSLNSIHKTLTRVAAMDREIQEARQRADAISREFQEVRQRSAKLKIEYRRMVQQVIPSMERVRVQVARRAMYRSWPERGRELLTNRLSEQEKERLKLAATMVKNMSSAVRTVQRLPIPYNIGLKIVRATLPRKSS